MKILIVCKNEHITYLIKKNLYKNIGGELNIDYVNSFLDVKEVKNPYLLAIVHIDECRILSEKIKMSSTWKNTYFIYISKNNKKMENVFGYNAIGYFTYYQLDKMHTQLNDFLQYIACRHDCYFKTEQGIELFKYEDIILFERINRKIYMQTSYNEYRLINYNLNDLINLLDQRFKFINQSTIINKNKILSITNKHEIIIQVRTKKYYLKYSEKKSIKINKRTGYLDNF